MSPAAGSDAPELAASAWSLVYYYKLQKFSSGARRLAGPLSRASGNASCPSPGLTGPRTIAGVFMSPDGVAARPSHLENCIDL